VVLSLGLSAVRIYRDDVLAMRPRQGLTPPPAET
jgi:hypothetical protein